MKTVTLSKDIFTGIIKEIDIPKGVEKIEMSDYQDNYREKYFKYYYTSKKGNRKECNIKYI